MNTYKKKYLKYENKYLKLKNQLYTDKVDFVLGFDTFNSNNIKIVNGAFTETQIETLHCMINDYFHNTFLPSIKNLSRPLSKSYGDVVERKSGRFEIIPPKYVYNQIYRILQESEKFNTYNKMARDEIIKFTEEDVVEEMCLLPIQPGMGILDGDFHRDIFVKSHNDFVSKPYYITHLIYLDDISSTEFCINSQNNPDTETFKCYKLSQFVPNCAKFIAI